MPKTRYTIDLADLVLMADVACELDHAKQFYIDQPDQQQRLAGMVQRLHDTVERAAQEDAAQIYGESEETRPCMTWILTASGWHFDFADPQPDQIDVRDIAQAQRAFKITFASEAYCKDIPLPLKLMLPDYKAIERRVDGAIRARFGLPEKCSAAVKHADLVMLATERRDLMPADDTPWPVLADVTPAACVIRPAPPNEARYSFWNRYCELTGCPD